MAEENNFARLTQQLTDILAAMQRANEPEPARTEPTIRFLEVARGNNALTPTLLTIPNWKRSSLKPVDQEKYKMNATRGLEDKFSLMSVSGAFIDGIELLKENVVATKLIERAKEHCKSYGMDEVFQIVTPPAAGSVIDATTNKDLFTDYSKITKQQILDSTTFFRQYGQEYDLQNLAWSEQFFRNCCDSVLSDKMDERMEKYTDAQKGGPIYFYEMMQAILTLTSDAAALMKERLRSLTLQDFKGEDVHKLVTLLRGTIKRLEMIDDVPVDMPKQLITIFQTCSVPEFVQIFNTIASLHTLGPLTGGQKYDSPTLLEAAESAYLSLSTSWNVPDNSKTSTFVAQQGPTCWGCGERGHIIDNCPHKTEAEKKNQVHSQPVPPARQEPQTAQTPLQIPTSEPANASPYASTMDVDSPTLTSFGLGVSNSVSSEEEDAGTRENPIEIGTTPTKTSTPPTTRRYPLRNRVPTNRYGRKTKGDP
jgi:hypothetical protein